MNKNTGLYNQIIEFYNRSLAEYNKHKELIHNFLLILSIGILLIVTLYSSFNSSNFVSTSSDAIVDSYLFGKGFKLSQVYLPQDHSNLLKIPLFYIQGHLPYHYTSFTIVNMLLVLITISAWSYLLIKIFGREYEIPILILMSGLVFCSVLFNLNIIESTIRNIEYPIALWFIININSLLKNKSLKIKEIILLILSSLLFSLVLAGDDLFYFVILLPIVIAILFYCIQSRKFNLTIFKSLCLLLVVSISALLEKSLASLSGLIIYAKQDNFALKVVNYKYLSDSIGVAFRQLLNLEAANIFSKSINKSTLFLFLNLGLFIIGLTGLILILIHASKRFIKGGITDSNYFILFALSLSFFMAFTVYVISGQVVTLQNNHLVSLSQFRYITIMPLLNIVGVIYIIKKYYNRHLAVYLVLGVLLISMVFAYPTIGGEYKSVTQNDSPSRASLVSVTNKLESNHVKVALTGYWYGVSVRFWSDNKIQVAPKSGCNTPFYFNASKSWFRPKVNLKSALVIEHNGPDSIYWNCTNSELYSLYGKPIKKVLAFGSNGNYIQIWIYNYDISSKLLKV